MTLPHSTTKINTVYRNVRNSIHQQAFSTRSPLMAISHVWNAIESPVLRRPLCHSQTGIFSRTHEHYIVLNHSSRYSMERSSGSSLRSSPKVASSSPLAVDTQDHELIRDAVAWCAQHGLVCASDRFDCSWCKEN